MPGFFVCFTCVVSEGDAHTAHSNIDRISHSTTGCVGGRAAMVMVVIDDGAVRGVAAGFSTVTDASAVSVAHAVFWFDVVTIVVVHVTVTSVCSRVAYDPSGGRAMVNVVSCCVVMDTMVAMCAVWAMMHYRVTSRCTSVAYGRCRGCCTCFGHSFGAVIALDLFARGRGGCCGSGSTTTLSEDC